MKMCIMTEAPEHQAYETIKEIEQAIETVEGLK